MTPPAWIVDQMWGFGVALARRHDHELPRDARRRSTTDFREIGPAHAHLRRRGSGRTWPPRSGSRWTMPGLSTARCSAWPNGSARPVVDRRSAKKPVPFRLRLLQRPGQGAGRSTPSWTASAAADFMSAYTGGHPISPDVIRFFRACGLNLKQCYGLTEAGGIFQVQPDDEVKPETVGKALPGDRGQDRRGPGGPGAEPRRSSQATTTTIEATEDAFENGWLLTGDAGYLDHDGHLVIIGRKEEIIREQERATPSRPTSSRPGSSSVPISRKRSSSAKGRPYITALHQHRHGQRGQLGRGAHDPLHDLHGPLAAAARWKNSILGEVRNGERTACPSP
ncbi:MAG: AMP-binding protein [Desulfobacterales bacterium]|nr:AMP-binding protein [Desulfobacterales bacterium]